MGWLWLLAGGAGSKRRFFGAAVLFATLLAFLVDSGGMASAAGPTGPAPVCSGGICTVTYAYNSAVELAGQPLKWTVPAGVTSATFDVRGAQGGPAWFGPATGGLGGDATGTLSVSPGQSYLLVPGSAGNNPSNPSPNGGYPDGGPVGALDASGDGGGSSSVWFGSTLDLMAGGGGGGGQMSGDGIGSGYGGWGGQVGQPGGAGAALNDQMGAIDGGGGGGGGATQSAPGSGGSGGTVTGTPPAGHTPHSGPAGGNGAGPVPVPIAVFAEGGSGGGGGGGGYFSGGGGGQGSLETGYLGVGYGSLGAAGDGGGGGGSSYAIGSATQVSYQSGVQSGDGEIVISYADPITGTTPVYKAYTGRQLSESGAGSVLSESGVSGPNHEPLTASLVSQTGEGVLNFNASDTSFTYTPNPPSQSNPTGSGSDSFWVQFQDSYGDYVKVLVLVTIVGTPTARITSPASGSSFPQGAPASTAFSCTEAPDGSGLASCSDSGGASGTAGTLNTSTPGTFTYTVTATSSDGLSGHTSISYTVTPPATSTSTSTTPSSTTPTTSATPTTPTTAAPPTPGTPPTTSSTPTTPTGPTAMVPQNTAPPRLGGRAKSGDTLTCSPGSWQPATASISYQWYRDKLPLELARGSDYKVGVVDDGSTLSCTVTATYASGASASAHTKTVTVPLPRGCPKPPVSVLGSMLGEVRLGMTQSQVAQAFGRPGRGHAALLTSRHTCPGQSSLRLGYGSAELTATVGGHRSAALSGRVVWAATASALYSYDGVRVGVALDYVKQRFRRGRLLKVGRNSWWVTTARGVTSMFGISHNALELFALVDSRLTSTGRGAGSVARTLG